MYGEHHKRQSFKSSFSGSSPHVRGARRGDLRDFLNLGIIPACTGSTSASGESFTRLRDHPRMYGEHYDLTSLSCFCEGSSPHVRGARVELHNVGIVAGIIPACTGSTRSLTLTPWRRWDHPRMYGEHSSALRDARLTAGSSPHVRGAPNDATLALNPLGIIPACTGSTKTSRSVSFWAKGSSPHVRGAPKA